MSDDIVLSSLLRLDRVGFYGGPLRRDVVSFFGAVADRLLSFTVLYIEVGDRRIASIVFGDETDIHDIPDAEWISVDPARTLLCLELVLSKSNNMERGLHELEFVGADGSISLRKSTDSFGLEYLDIHRKTGDPLA